MYIPFESICDTPSRNAYADARKPPLMGRYESIDYAAYAKRGFLLGALGGTLAPAVVGSLGPLAKQAFVDAEILGILLGLFAPLVFGVALPLIE